MATCVADHPAGCVSAFGHLINGHDAPSLGRKPDRACPANAGTGAGDDDYWLIGHGRSWNQGFVNFSKGPWRSRFNR